MTNPVRYKHSPSPRSPPNEHDFDADNISDESTGKKGYEGTSSWRGSGSLFPGGMNSGDHGIGFTTGREGQTMGYDIATYARNYERMVGHQISYHEMVCNQFVIRVLQGTVAPHFPNTLADDFVNSPHFQRVDTPRAGDLIHWPGHIGIVLDPDHGIFIGSQTKTGVAEANYKGQSYWNGDFQGKKPDYFLRFIG